MLTEDQIEQVAAVHELLPEDNYKYYKLVRGVMRGTHLLDQHAAPGWRSQIDWDIFDFNDCRFCTFGQVHGWMKDHPDRGVASDWADMVESEEWVDIIHESNGFNLQGPEWRKWQPVITDLWLCECVSE